MSDAVTSLGKQGVTVHCPDSVEIDSSVALHRISEGVIIHSGCRISGAQTSIGPGSVIGAEGPAILQNCQLGARVTIGSGFFSGVTLLDDVVIGANAHLRPGTILEEQAACGHSAGLKQTIMMPFTVTGSLINFCDCMLSGGTSRSNHSEVGSSYVHFNYTPHRDKATPSLLGDVPRGVMLNQSPIFLGGQGGLVGPARIEFGTIIAAGTVQRRDVTTPGQLVFGGPNSLPVQTSYDMRIYGDIRRILENNFIYLGNLFALLEWYHHVRSAFLSGTAHGEACHSGAISNIRNGIDERLNRLTQLTERLALSVGTASEQAGTDISGPPYRVQADFSAAWPSIEEKLLSYSPEKSGLRERDAFLSGLQASGRSAPYIDAIRSLSDKEKRTGTAWLRTIVDETVNRCVF